MIYSRKYSRNFIPLKQDGSKHNLDFRPALGRCVIEIKDGKGKVNIYAQGINPKYDYYLEFIGFEKGNIKNVCLGKFNVDSYGKGEFSAQFDPDNMENNKSKIEDFNVVSVMVKDNKDISSALVGYIGNEIDWKEQYKVNAIINIGKGNSCVEMPEDNNSNNNLGNNNNPNNNNTSNTNNNNISDIEQGLIDKEEGLLEREQGLIDREKELIEREESKTKIPLDDYEKNLKEKLDGLAEKEKGLAEKEQGLLEKERALKQGFLPTDDKEIREKEIALIKKEIELIKIEQELINRERMLIRQNPTSEREKGLIEKEKGILEREQGLLEREKGLIEKEKGLLDIEKGIREKNKYTKKEMVDNSTSKNHENFKDMLDNLRKSMMNIQNMDTKMKITNSHIDYIKDRNITMNPFLKNEDNISWYRISPYDLTSISNNSWKYANNPFVFTSYKKYKHLMLGINNKSDKETYTLAVPCRYEQDFSLKDFKEFLPVDNNVSSQSIDNGEYGYRIMEL
ncbi:hypothetical protein [uncultured Tyzzerella sp.]|uniref:hypothetical protein n=1 Tax=uncultured Tyzzerella sp. TaxID=2321398 RepID=UPI00294248C3|nr:hypothetical protein [uncultured Tyzzerella sp.]